MSLNQRVLDFIVQAGTDYKQFRTWITGSNTGDLSGLTTTAKSSLIAAINEVKASATGAPPAATETAAGVAAIATQSEANAGTVDAKFITPLKFVTKLAAFAQPLSTNLTNLANLASQTTYGQAFLTLTGQSQLMGLLPSATDTVVGVARNATQAEVNAGTNDATDVTPLKLQTRLAAFAVPLTYLDTDVTLAGNSDTKLATQKAMKAYADALLDANNAYQYKGGIDCSANPNYPAASAGWTYKVTVAGKIGGAAGTNVEAGDSLTCLVDGSSAGNQATVGANWLITQTNIDGAVVGPAVSTANDLAMFSGTTGKVVSDSGVSVDTDGTLAANSDAKLPTDKAVRTFLGVNYYTQTQIGNPETDLVAAYTTAKS